MDILAYSLKRIRQSIPREILNLAFGSRRYNPARQEYYRDNSGGTSIDAAINDRVLIGRLATEVNLCSGVEATLDLRGVPREKVDLASWVYRIPDSLTGGRLITAVYGVTFGNRNGFYDRDSYMQGSSPLLDRTRAVLDSYSPVVDNNTPYVRTLGHNVIIVEDVLASNQEGRLHCQLTHEPNFGNIKPAYYNKFGEMAVLAAKAEIHTSLVIDLDEGQIKAGSALGRIREIVDNYADADTMFHEFLRTRWKVSAIINDDKRYEKIIKMGMGRFR